jgi:hypothetical protein
LEPNEENGFFNMKSSSPAPQIPFLVQFAVDRTSHPEIEGAYSPDLHVWAIDTPDGPMPIIELRKDFIEALTKTRVNQEADDDQGRSILSEFLTKTDVKQESDDASYAANLLELETKTEAEMEHDDQSRPLV